MGESTRHDWRHSLRLTFPFLLLAFLLHFLYGKSTHLNIHTHPQVLKAGPPRNCRKSHGRHRNRRLQVGSKGEAAALLCRFSSSSPRPLRNPSKCGIVSHLLIFLRLALGGCTSCPRLPRSAGCGAFGCLGRLRSRIYSFEDLIKILFCALCKAAALLSEENKRREGGRRRGAFLFLEPFPHIQSLASLF